MPDISATKYASRLGRRLLQVDAGYGFGFCLGVLFFCSLVGLIFYVCDLAESAIITVYILGSLLVAVLTDKTRYWTFSSVAAVLLFNCLYAEPRFTLLYYDPRHTVTMLMLLLASLLAGGLTQTFRRRMQDKTAADVAAQSERLRADLLRSVSHDLRTPLTGISGDAQILLSKGAEMSGETRTQLYQHIYDNSEWLISMVENILFVTRLDNANQEIGLQTELLAELVDEALQHVSKKSADHIITRQVEDEMQLVTVDANMIIRVIVNLVNNAIKHTQSGSHIIVSAFCRDEDTAVVEVADDGPGLGLAAERVFDMFYSTPGTEAGEPHGMGLGLALCKSIVKAHGGEIYCHENMPHGAVFGFTLQTEKMEDQA